MIQKYALGTLLVVVLLSAAPLVARVQPSDFNYLGSFEVTCSQDWCTYGQFGIDIADGGSALWITGHAYDAQVTKISIPPIGGSAQKLSGPTDYLGSCPEDENWHLGAIEESGGTLRATCNYTYNVAGNDLDTYHDGPGASPQHIGPRAAPFSSQKMGAYLFEVPADFASQYLGGRRLITGFSREAGALGGSQGPTLIAFDRGNPSSALDLVWYRQHYPECNWDDYSTCDFPGYRTADSWEGATWVRSAAGDAILIVGQKGLGDNFYGDARPGDCSSYKGYHSDPYEGQIIFYDPADIVDRLEGNLEPWEVLPYATMVLNGVGGWGECTDAGGMTFDQDSGRLYLVHKSGAGNGQPIIHVWQADADPPPPPFCGDGTCDPGEDYLSCPADCQAPPSCGDGICNGDEDFQTCPADCEAPPPPPTEGLLAYYSLDEGSGGTVAWDSSGNGHHGTLVNGAQWFEGMAVEFDGQNDYIDLGGLDVPGGAITLAAWFKSDDLLNCSSGDCRLISKATSTSEGDHYFMLSTIREGGSTRLRFRLKTGGTTTTLIASSGDLEGDVWVHAAAVYNGSYMRLYKDGDLVGTTTKSGSIATNSSVPVWIGGNPDGPTSMPWQGTIDEVRIYSQALTASEIRTLPPPGKANLFGDSFESGDTSAWSTAVH